jgi:hypothetical protein
MFSAAGKMSAMQKTYFVESWDWHKYQLNRPDFRTLKPDSLWKIQKRHLLPPFRLLPSWP